MKIKIIVMIILSSISIYGQDNKNNDLLSKYYNLGIPTANKIWSFDEYKKTIEILLEVNSKKLLELPSVKNDAAKIFNKITDFKDYWFYESSAFNNKDKICFIIYL